MHPWRNWIAHQIPILTVGGSSPPGCTTQKPQLILRFYRILQADLVPFANAIGAVRNNRYYAHFVHYKSAWVYHEKGKSN